jgi:hypothetical protein
MKSAIITAAGKTPVYGDFNEPVASGGKELITVSASALSPFSIAEAVENAKPVHFAHVGGSTREENIELPGAALRSSAIQLMGSGLKSIPFPKLLNSIGNVFVAAMPPKLQIATKIVFLSAIEDSWDAPGKLRIVVTIPWRSDHSPVDRLDQSNEFFA